MANLDLVARKLASLGILPIACAFTYSSASSTEAATVAKQSAVCAELKKIRMSKGGFVHRALHTVKENDGISRIYNVDIDGDDVSDEIVWTPSGSASKVPADETTLTITLSTGGKIEFQEPRFNLFRYQAKVYVSSVDFDAGGKIAGDKIYSLNKTGVRLICKLPSQTQQ